MNLDEVWKSVQEFPRYLVSNQGQIKNIKTGHILKQSTNGTGKYPHVRLCDDNGCNTKRVHKIVASAFLGETPKGLEINHIDGVKTNNKDTNYEFVTHKRNMEHAKRVLNRSLGGSKQKAIRVVETGEVFLSITEAANSLGVRQGSISNVLRGYSKTLHGYHFELIY